MLPIWSSGKVNLNGDGGFTFIQSKESDTICEFTPISVHGLWSTNQKLIQCIEQARSEKQYVGSGLLNWTLEYSKRVDSDKKCRAEWDYVSDLWSSKTDSQFAFTTGFTQVDDSSEISILSVIRTELKAVMNTMDLYEVRSSDVFKALEKRFQNKIDLKNYKKFIDQEMLTVYGQMESPSKINDFIYLGSEWNASNKEELKKNNVGYILNISKEIDNFFPDEFIYKKLRLYDIPESDLLQYWEETFKFINEARLAGKCILVHCKMGISRSASTVIAYLIKSEGWDLPRASQFVKSKRAIICPNEGFKEQLFIYNGIVKASRNRNVTECSWEHDSDTDDNECEMRKRSFSLKSITSVQERIDVFEGRNSPEQQKTSAVSRSNSLPASPEKKYTRR